MSKKRTKEGKNDDQLPSNEVSKLREDFEPWYDPYTTEEIGLGYQNTVLYGHYSRKLGEFARLQKLVQGPKDEEDKRKGLKAKVRQLKTYFSIFIIVFKFCWRNTLGRIGEEWIFLTIVGILAGTLSFTIDRTIGICNSSRQWLYKEVALDNIPAQYFAWCALPVVLVLFSTGFTYLVGPQAVGSGVSEIKVIIRGVPLKGFLSFRTLVANAVGMACAVGAQMQVGREGPLIHIACCMVHVLSKYLSNFKGVYRNRSRQTEMLAAACAIGVGCCFGAPIGGLIMSVEVTTTYYYTRNYMRGFYGALWATIFYRLLEAWWKNTHTMLPKFPITYAMDFPFKPQEMFVYALVGISCGIGGGIFVQIHRNYVMYVKGWSPIKKLFGKFRYLYPLVLSWLVVSLTFPPGVGRFMAGHIGTGVQMKNLFSNFTWSAANLTVEQQAVVNNWTTPMSGIFCNLSVFIAFTYFFTILCATLPVPCGCFMPTFKIGAGFGRIIGELMHTWFPEGIKYYDMITPVTPGGYALAGGAAFTGAVTHTIAPVIIAFEMTGQIKTLVPSLICVVLSNAVASLIAPGHYDSGILFKNLPYLPDLLPCSSGMHSVYAKDFMVKEVKYIWHNMSFANLKDVLKLNKDIRQFPLVDSEENMHLLGSIHRMQLIRVLENQVGTERRQQWVTTRVKEAQEKARLQSVQQPETHKRTSRFEVMPSPDVLVVKKLTTDAWGIEQFPKDTTYDMSPEDRRRWEEEQMRLPVDFSKCRIDPAPFQLVETTSLLKVHSLFSMIGIDTGYVTAQGKLVGVIGLTELRQAIQDSNDGKLPPHDLEIEVASRTPRKEGGEEDGEMRAKLQKDSDA